jgi:hypothetical protein
LKNVAIQKSFSAKHNFVDVPSAVLNDRDGFETASCSGYLEFAAALVVFGFPPLPAQFHASRRHFDFDYMPEMFWVKWFPTDWASEPGLRLCEAATRGIWFELLNLMFLMKVAKVVGTEDELSKQCMCRTSQMQLALKELSRFQIAEITYSNGNVGAPSKTINDQLNSADSVTVTVLSRRLKRESNERERIRLAVQINREKRKCNENVTSNSNSISISVQDRGVGKGVKIPSWDEWWGICQMVGIPEWKSMDEFRRQTSQDDPWKGARGNLQSHAARVKSWWERDGRHLTPPTKDKDGKPVGPSLIERQFDRQLNQIKNIKTKLPE